MIDVKYQFRILDNVTFFSVSGIDGAILSIDGCSLGVRTDKFGYFSFEVPFCSRKIVIKVSKDGYVSTMKVLDIPDDTLRLIENVQIVLFRLAEPQPLSPDKENILRTTGAVRVRIPAGTTFEDKTGNGPVGTVSAILNFFDPGKDNFMDAPGRFVTDRGEELLTAGVANLRFQDEAGNNMLPNGDIRIVLADIDPTRYILWTLNEDGVWQKKKSKINVKPAALERQTSSFRRSRRQSDGEDIGGFDRNDIGTWINCDRIPETELCFVKTRVFEDVSFTTEVQDGGVDTYKSRFLLVFGNAAPYQGMNFYKPQTNSPGKTCYEVRCGEDPRVQGLVSVITQETLGNGQSIPFPAIPVQLGNTNLPPVLNTELGNLNYQVDPDEKEAVLDFISSPTGPLYTDLTTCEQSDSSENALWFARRQPTFTETDFGNDVCYARITIHHKTQAPAGYVDQIKGTSGWGGTSPYKYADSIVQRQDFVFIPTNDYVCLRYRCSEDNDLTTVYIQTLLRNRKAICYGRSSQLDTYTGQFTAPVLDGTNIAYGYYKGADERLVKDECLSERDPEKSVIYISCYIRQQ